MENDIGGDLGTLRKKKMHDLRRSLAEEQQKEQMQDQIRAKKDAAMKMILTPEARLRLANIKMVKSEFAENLEIQLLQIAQSGKVPLPINDKQLKTILSRFQNNRKEFNIRRI